MDYDMALARYRRTDAGRTAPLVPEAREAYLCEALGLPPSEVARLSWEQAEYLLGWREGRALGEWLQQREAERGVRMRHQQQGQIGLTLPYPERRRPKRPDAE